MSTTSSVLQLQVYQYTCNNYDCSWCKLFIVDEEEVKRYEEGEEDEEEEDMG